MHFSVNHYIKTANTLYHAFGPLAGSYDSSTKTSTESKLSQTYIVATQVFQTTNFFNSLKHLRANR